MHRLARRPLVAVVLGAVDMALGLVLIIEAPERVSSPAFAVARQAPGGMKTWGVVLLILSVAIIGRTAFEHALSLAGAWHAFFVVALFAAAIHDGTVPLTGICVYIGVVLLHLLAAWRKVR